MLLAQGSKVLLDLIGDSALTAIGTAGLSVSLVAPGMWVGICAALSRYFPDQNWREAVRCGYASMGQTKLNARQVDGLTAVLCLLLTAVCWANGVEGGLAVAGWWLVGGCLYWGGVMLAALLIAFQKERGTVLAEQQYRQEMQSFLNVIRSQRHDYNFHVQTIAGLIQEGKMDECRQYVSALEQDSIRMNAVLPVQDPAIAAMIHNDRRDPGAGKPGEIWGASRTPGSGGHPVCLGQMRRGNTQMGRRKAQIDQRPCRTYFRTLNS